jgi:hypothetical protein
MLDQFRKGYRDSKLLNFMVKIEKGRGLQNFLHFRDETFDHWWGFLYLLFFAAIYHIFSRLLLLW